MSDVPVTDGQFRNLAPVPDPEGDASTSNRLRVVEQELQSYHRILSMFGTQAWKEVRSMLEVELQKGVNIIVKHGLGDPATEFVRGQIQAYQFLTNLGEAVRQNQQVARAELESLQKRAGEQ